MKNKKSPLIFINQEIHSDNEDHIGMSSYVESISEAIDAGASMIGITADYGSGKSSLVELLKIKDKKDKKFIKVNMWDTTNSVAVKMEENKSESAVSFLEKSFLYQIALNSKKKYLSKHVNKRLNSSNGLISFTSPKKSIWFYFIIAAILVAGGIMIHSFDFNIKVNEFVFTNFIYNACYLLAAVVMIFGLINSSFSFSSWKSEATRKLDDSDIFSIYSEILDVIDNKCSSKKQKKIFIIEDLDRFDDKRAVVNFIKTIYRFNTLSVGHNICFIISIKPEYKLKSELLDVEKDEVDYNKWFDFIIDLKPIHIHDYKLVLNELLNEKKFEIKELTQQDLDNSEYQILISDKNLNIRALKQRLNYAFILYKSLINKQSGTNKFAVNMRTCCAVSLLRTKYEKQYFALLNSENEFNNIINDSIKLIAKKLYTPDNLIREIVVVIDKYVNSSKTELGDDFKYQIANFISNKIIGDDYRMYFYSYPKGSYIKTIEESELEDLILLNNENAIESQHLNSLVEIALERNGYILNYCFDLLKEIPKSFPIIVVENEKMLNYAYTKYKESLIDSLCKQLLWNKENEDATVKYVSLINSYSMDDKENILKDYAQAVSGHVSSLGNNAITCREKLISAIGSNISWFDCIFKRTGVPILSENEIDMLDESTAFKLINPSLIDVKTILKLLMRYEQFSDTNKILITQWLVAQLKNISNNEEYTTLILSFMHNNKIVDDKLFAYIIKSYSKDLHIKITDYLNDLNELTLAYLEELYKILFVSSNFNEKIYESMLREKFYILYLINRIISDTLSDKDYDTSIFDASVLDQLKSIEPISIYLKYRQKWLAHYLESDENNYQILYNRNTPFITEDEIDILSCEQFAKIYMGDNLPVGIDSEFVSFISKKVNSAEDAYMLAKIILQSTNFVDKKSVFETIPFSKVKYYKLESNKKYEIMDLYKVVESIDTIKGLLHYMQITDDINERIDSDLYNYIIENYNETGVWDENSIKMLVEVCNGIGYVSPLILDIITKSEPQLPLCSAITNKLFEGKNYKQFIIGKTLYESKFTYVKGLPFNDYLDVYTSSNESVWLLMKESDEFLVDICNSNQFDHLSIEQLFLYNNWDQTIELVKVVLDKCENDDQRAKYILSMRVLKSQTDSDEFQRYMCNSRFSELMLRDDVCNKVKELIWDNRPHIKANLTKWINKIRKDMFNSNNEG